MAQAKVISAYSHVMEPADFWEKRLDQKYRDNAPRVVPKRNGKGYEAARPSGWDPAARLKDQDVDDVCAAVLYPTLGMPLFQLKDEALQRACFRVYNDWAAEFCDTIQSAWSRSADFANGACRSPNATTPNS